MSRKRQKPKTPDLIDAGTSPHLIEYIPPDQAMVDELVQKLSQHMASSQDDASYLDFDVTYGLKAFILLIGELKAKQLNEKQQ